MSREFRAKVFKSGNSVALRLPKALGVQEGVEMLVREEGGKYTFEPAPRTKQKIDLTGIAASMPWLKPLKREDFDDGPRDWHVLDRQDDR